MRVRSLLFTPANDDRKTAKAFMLGADSVTLDLEDAVAESEKDAARALAATALQSHRDAGCLRIVRVNSLPTGRTRDDLEGVMVPGLDAVLLPKVSSPDEVREVSSELDRLELAVARQEPPVQIIVLLETAKGIIHAHSILTASPRVTTALFGPGDYTLDIGTRMTVEGMEVLYARSHVVAAARAAERSAPIDGPYTIIDDLDGFETNARSGKLLGYGGKAVLHPSQLPICHAVFAVSAEELEWARRVDIAFREAEARGVSSIKLEDGEFVDYPIVYRAREILALAHKEI